MTMAATATATTHTLIYSIILCLLITGRTHSLSFQPKKTTSTASAASSRREWLATTAAVVASTATILSAAPQPANANPSFVSGLQGTIQDTIAPGHWIGQLIGLNSKTETWEFSNSSPEEVSRALVDVLENLTDDRKAKLYMPEFRIEKADANKVHVLTWTKLEWLDTLDVTFRSNGNGNGDGNGNGCTAKASFYATGFLPTSIPGAPLFNTFFFWFPFASPGPRGEMLQDFRLRAIKGLVTKKLAENVVTPDLYFP